MDGFLALINNNDEIDLEDNSSNINSVSNNNEIKEEELQINVCKIKEWYKQFNVLGNQTFIKQFNIYYINNLYQSTILILEKISLIIIYKKFCPYILKNY